MANSIGKQVLQRVFTDFSTNRPFSHAFCTTHSLLEPLKKEYKPSREAKKTIKELTSAVIAADRGKLRRPILAWQIYTKEHAGEERPAGEKRGNALVARKIEFENLPDKVKQMYIDMAAKDKERFLKEQAALPEKSGRAKSPFNFYVMERTPYRPTDMNMKDYMAAMAYDFQKLTDTQKEPYVKLHQADKIRVEKIRAALPAVVPRPLTAYQLFVKERLTGFTGAKSRMADVAREWKALSEEERQVYIDQAPPLKVHQRTRAVSAFNLFVKAQAPQKAAHETMKEAMLRLTGEWKAMGAVERKPYDDEAALDKLNFPPKNAP